MPRWFLRSSATSTHEIPSNDYGWQPSFGAASTGYLGLTAFVDAPNSAPGWILHDYALSWLHPESVNNTLTGPSHAALPGHDYYAEMHVSLADSMGRAVRQLGMLFMAAPPQTAQFGIQGQSDHAGVYRQASYSHTGGSLPALGQPQITRHAGAVNSFLDNKTGWTQVSGCFQVAPGTDSLDFLLIGDFADDNLTTSAVVPGAATQFSTADWSEPGITQRASYYYIANPSLYEFPTAGPDKVAACSALPTIGSGCALPSSSGASYQWSFRANATLPFTPIPGAIGQQVFLLADREGDYQLVVSVPEVDGSGVYAATTQCNVKLNAPFALALPPHFGPICPDESAATGVTLTATGAPTGSTFKWQFKPASGPGSQGTNWPAFYPAATGASVVVHPTRTTHYRVKAYHGTDSSCWTYTTVEVSPAPAVTSGGPYVFIQGTSGPWLLAGTPPAGTTAGVWTAGGGLILLHQGSKWLVSTTAAIGTYPATYTYTDRITGCSASVNTTISIQGCASRTGDGIPLLNFASGGVLSSSFTFQPYTRYHLTGPLTLEGVDYTLPEGCEILCDPTAQLIVGKQARLILLGATLTATCDQMWPGVQVLPTAYGIYAGTPSYDPVQSVAKPLSPDPSDGVTRVNEISHARTAIRIEDPEAAGYRLTFTQFLHNERNIELGTRFKALPPGTTGVITTGDIINCTFDADPGQFKQPLRAQQFVSEFALSTDVWDMGTCTIAGNYIAHQLVGILTESADDTDGFDTYVGNGQNASASNIFNQCYLAGIVVGGQTTNSTWANNQFWLPSAVTLWDTPQRKAFRLAHPTLQGLPTGAMGMYLLSAGGQSGTITGNAFVGNADDTGQSASLDNFDNPGLYAQTGLQATIHTSCTINNNSCTNLGTGFDLTVNSFSGSNHEVAANSFVDCGQGIVLNNNWQRDIQTNQPVPPAITPKLWTRCNTFSRSSNTAGNSYGMVLNEHATVRFEALSAGVNGTPADVMKNLFTGTASGGTFTHVWNDDANPVVSYRTFNPNQNNSTVPQTNSTSLITHNVVIPTGVRFVNDPNDPQGDPPNDCGSEDGIYDAGIQTRPLPTPPIVGGTLAVPIPNPADERVIFGYELPATSSTAELIVRESIQGGIVKRQFLPADEHEAQVSVRDLRPGIYLVSLLVNGRPIAARRLQIVR